MMIFTSEIMEKEEVYDIQGPVLEDSGVTT